MLISDAGVVARIAAESPSEGWTRSAFEKEVTTNAGSRYLVVEIDGAVVAFGGIWLVVDQAHITNMGVTARHQRRGLGRFLLHGLVDLATRSGMDDVTLEVRVSNAPARALYAAFGFHETGLRKAYYRDTGEDAVIMSTESLAGRSTLKKLEAIRLRLDREFPGAVPAVSVAAFEAWLSQRG